MDRRWWGGLVALLGLLVACSPKGSVLVAGGIKPSSGASSTPGSTPSPAAPVATTSVTATENGGQTLVHGRNVVETEFWDAAHVHLVDAMIGVDAPLTIAPGATVDFLPGAGLVIAPGGTGSMVASGSPGLPILFDSAAASPSPGDWCGIDVGSSAAIPSGAPGGSCVLDHVVVADAGQARAGQPTPPPGQDWAAVHVFPGSVLSVTDSTVSASAGSGLQLDVDPLQTAVTLNQFGKNAFEDNADYPIQMDPNLVGRLDTATTFTGDGTESVRLLALGGERTEIRTTQTWLKLTQDGNPSNSDVVPYSWPLALTSVEGTETLDHGVHILFDPQGVMDIYQYGQIDAMGTQMDPVIFDSINSLTYTAQPGDWVGLRFLCCQDELSNTDILHAGYGGLNNEYYSADLGVGNLYSAVTSVTLDGVLLMNGSGAGLAMDGNTAFPVDNYTNISNVGPATESVTWY